MADNDLLILGGIAVLAYLLTRQSSPQGSTTVIQAAPTAAASDCGGYGCGGGSTPSTPTPSPAPNNSFTSYWEQVKGASQGVYQPAAVDTVNPRLGSAVNDATLLMINRQINDANAAGNWDLSWQLAAKRDAWIKQMGY